jgi:hypothetical protein
MNIILLPLDAIRTDANTQMRVAQSAKTVDEYVDTLAKLPPITVFHIDGEYILADGFHRLAAYKKAGQDSIPCFVKEGTLDDAREFACCANQEHGLRRNDYDKRKAVEEFFKIPGRDALTNSEAARRLGFSTPFVKNIRDSLGVKASPASHHGAGATKQRLNDFIRPVKPTGGAGLNDLIPDSETKEGKTISLPTGNKHEFAVALLQNFDLEYLKSCTKYLNDLF